MNQVMGVAHKDRSVKDQVKELDKLLAKAPKTMMLELPANWERYKDLPAFRNKYFVVLAKIFQERGTKIIAGDVNNFSMIEYLEFEKESYERGNSLKDILLEIVDEFKKLYKIPKYFIGTLDYVFNKDKRVIRDNGFLETYKKFKPEVTVVGDLHANVLKQKLGNEVNYFSLGAVKKKTREALESLFSEYDFELGEEASASTEHMLHPS